MTFFLNREIVFLLTTHPHSPTTGANIQYSYPYNQNLNPAVSELECTGDETRLLDCAHVATTFCSSYNAAVYVDCLISPPNYTPGQLQIDILETIQHDNRKVGVLKMFVQDDWAYFCGALDHKTSNLACRSLGYYGKGKRGASFCPREHERKRHLTG